MPDRLRVEVFHRKKQHRKSGWSSKKQGPNSNHLGSRYSYVCMCVRSHSYLYMFILACTCLCVYIHVSLHVNREHPWTHISSNLFLGQFNNIMDSKKPAILGSLWEESLVWQTKHDLGGFMRMKDCCNNPHAHKSCKLVMWWSCTSKSRDFKCILCINMYMYAYMDGFLHSILYLIRLHVHTCRQRRDKLCRSGKLFNGESWFVADWSTPVFGGYTPEI